MLMALVMLDIIEAVEARAAEVPVVVTTPVVATPAVEALALRQESDEPAWI